MAVAINTHSYKPRYITEYNFTKTGERSILWGAIKWTVGRTDKQEFDTGLCKYCFKPLVDHKQFKLDRYE